MEEKLNENTNIFIVKVGGTKSKTINIPDAVCEFCDIHQGDLIKLKLLDKSFSNQNKNKKDKKNDKKNKS